MFLNETNPPLDEALEHFGVKGMHWGRRKARPEPMHDTNHDFFDEEQHNASKRKIALGVLAVAGTAATVAILHKNGMLKIPNLQNLQANSQAERARNQEFAKEAFKKFKKTRPHSQTKAASDFIDAGFGENGVFNVTTMARGATRVNNFSPNFMNTPILALPRGR